jgi:hypothetical protein
MRRSSDGGVLVHPASLRQPLIDALSDLFIPCWPDTSLPIELFAAGLALAVEALLRGNHQVQLHDVPVGLLDNIMHSPGRSCCRVTAGTRRRPEAGYSYRLVAEGRQVGAVLLVDVTACRPGDIPVVFLRIASVFSKEEFDRERKSVMRAKYEAEGLTDNLLAEMTPKQREPDQTLDYDLEFSAPTPSPR